MPFLLLLLLTLIFLQGSYPAPRFLGSCQLASALATWGGTFACIGLAVVLARFCAAHLKRRPIERSRILQRFAHWRRCHFCGMLGFYLLALYLLGWGWLWSPVAEAAGASGIAATTLPGMQMVLLSPFLAALISSWVCFYDVERAAYQVAADEDSEPFLSRWSYVGLQARQNLLLVIPPLVPLTIQQIVLYAYPNLDRLYTEAFAAGLLLATFLTIPWMLRLILGLRPLPAGPLRTRLMGAANRLKFRFNDVLVWNSRSTMANAMVTGPLPWLRYVVLTDRLIDSLTDEEIEAVFGHEVGHIKHHHMTFYLLFLLASVAALGGLWNIAFDWIKSPDFVAGMAHLSGQPFAQALLPALTGMWLQVLEGLTAVALVTFVSLYVVVVFGFLSRRCERQADIYGCRAVSCDVFIRALEKVAYLNGIDRERPGWLSSWQHSTIARRVAFLRQMSADPQVEPRFQRRVGILKWAVVAVLALALFVLREHLWAQPM